MIADASAKRKKTGRQTPLRRLSGRKADEGEKTVEDCWPTTGENQRIRPAPAATRHDSKGPGPQSLVNASQKRMRDENASVPQGVMEETDPGGVYVFGGGGNSRVTGVFCSSEQGGSDRPMGIYQKRGGRKRRV